MEKPNPAMEKIAGILIGCVLLIGDLLLMRLVYHDYKYPISAQIIEQKSACQVGWKDGKNYSRRVMDCAEVADFTAGRSDILQIFRGKSVRLVFASPDGVIENKTAFFSDQWLLDNSHGDVIPINYYPDTPNPIRSPPNFFDPKLVAFFGFMALMGGLFPLFGFIGARRRQRRYERRIAEGAQTTEAPTRRKKWLHLLYFLGGLVVLIGKFCATWSGHFSWRGFALGLLVSVPIYLWIAWALVKSLNRKNDPLEDLVTAATRERSVYRFLILTGLASFVLVPTLLAFASPFK